MLCCFKGVKNILIGFPLFRFAEYLVHSEVLKSVGEADKMAATTINSVNSFSTTSGPSCLLLFKKTVLKTRL